MFTLFVVTGSGVGVNSVKPKQPPQILPKPPGSGPTSTAKVAPSPQSHTSSPQLTTLPQQQQGTLVFNQVSAQHSNTGFIILLLCAMCY